MRSKRHTRAPRAVSGSVRNPGPLLAILKAVTLGLLATTAMLLLFSFAFSWKDLPLRLLQPLTLAAMMAGAFTAGYWSARFWKRQGFLTGAICGGIFVAICFLASLQAGGGVDLTALLRLTILLLCGMIGGVTGINRKVRPLKGKR